MSIAPRSYRLPSEGGAKGWNTDLRKVRKKDREGQKTTGVMENNKEKYQRRKALQARRNRGSKGWVMDRKR